MPKSPKQAAQEAYRYWANNKEFIFSRKEPYRAALNAVGYGPKDGTIDWTTAVDDLEMLITKNPL